MLVLTNAPEKNEAGVVRGRAGATKGNPTPTVSSPPSPHIRERGITERIAKRIRRGQGWGKSSVPDDVIVRWASQYATVLSTMKRMK
jgi:hypothetical protein